MVDEAKLIETDGVLEPEGAGWFVVNVRDATWWRSDVFGASCPFEGNEDEKRRKANAAEARFSEYGLNIHVVLPGQANCMYHGEDAQEPVAEVAQNHGAAVEQETTEPPEAYARFPRWERAPLEDAGLPWQ